jgi:hypothetical protein
MCKTVSGKVRFLFCLLLLFSCSASAAFGGAQLQARQGQYFRISVPPGWKVNETSSAVEVGAPDGRTGYSFALLMGGFGQMSPQTFLNMLLNNGTYQNPKILRIQQLPSQPGPMGIPWQVIEADLQYVYLGTPVNAYAVCAVIQGAGQYSAVVRAYQAPQPRWDKIRSLLAAIDTSLLITNPYQVAGLDKVQLPRGTSHDEIYGDYNARYHQRHRESDARLSQQRHQATMEYERMKDPRTGQLYDMPMSEYDATVGGYRNPKDPSQLLVPAAPGE